MRRLPINSVPVIDHLHNKRLRRATVSHKLEDELRSTKRSLQRTRLTASAIAVAAVLSTVIGYPQVNAISANKPKPTTALSCSPETITLNPNLNNSGMVWSGPWSGNANSYSRARSGLDQLFAVKYNITTVGQAKQSDPDGDIYSAYEAFFDFNTQLPAGARVVSAKLSVSLFQNYTTTPYTIEAYADNYGTTLGNEDWIVGAPAGQPVATIATSALHSGLNDLTSSGLETVVNPNGTTRLLLTSSLLRAGTVPAGGQDIDLNVAPTTLTIVYQ